MVPGRKAWNTLTCVDKGMHRHRRKLVSQGLCDDSLRSFEPALPYYIDIFCGKLDVGAVNHSGWTEPKDFVHLVQVVYSQQYV